MTADHFIRRFQKRFLLRFHMSLILTATCLSGVLFSKLLLLLSVDNVLVRYPLAACLSYCLFFLFIKLWLWNIATTTRQKVANSPAECLPGARFDMVSRGATVEHSPGGWQRQDRPHREGKETMLK